MRQPSAEAAPGRAGCAECECTVRTGKVRWRSGTARCFPRDPSATRLTAALVLGAVLSLSALPAAQAARHDLPLLRPAGHAQEGHVRVINHSNAPGTVRITGIDDTGRRRGPVNLRLKARETRHFNSRDLERGNASQGLSGRLGDGRGNWRLELWTALDIEPSAYTRVAGGFLTAMHAVARTARNARGGIVHHVPIFNPASKRSQRSWLRVVNRAARRVTVTVTARDDAGKWGPGGAVRFAVAAGGARMVSAQQLEAGGAGLVGRLGDGTGRWQFFVTAGGAVEVMSLMQSATGHLSNLSASGLREAAASKLPPAGSGFRDCPECPEMVVVPAGSFLMGSLPGEIDRDGDEGPRHRVTIARPFSVGAYEVTFAQWDACRRAGGCSHNPDGQGWGRGTRPVVDVSWHDAQQYVRWLSRKTGERYRLLSESEWEYVARAGTTTRYWWGGAIARSRANCDGCGSRWDGRRTAPVGTFRPNAFGLYDVHGNVWEWVQDCEHGSYSGAPSDGRAWTTGGSCGRRAIRGGSWETLPRYLRSANRGWLVSGSRSFPREGVPVRETGFRVARALAAQAQHSLPLLRPAGHVQEGHVRVINHSNAPGAVRIVGIDDTGRRHGPVNLRLKPRESRHFNARDLERGNASQGLSGRLGDGRGNWRLELSTVLDIEPSAYVRAAGGFLNTMHAVARTARNARGGVVHHVPIFNPASERLQRSWLRVVNRSARRVTAAVTARDDAGRAGPGGGVKFAVAAGGARMLSAQQLEAGGAGLVGRLGDGTGRWQLFVTAGGAVEVMSLMQGAAGHLSNVSGTPRGDDRFVIAAVGSTAVQPLQTIPLTVPGGLGASNYTVLVDLSGTGAFRQDDTLEVKGITTYQNRILFASPLTEILPETNTARRIAVRVRRSEDGELSNILRFSIAEITIPASLAGYPTVLLEVILKGIYVSVDDPLLNAEAPSIQPGSMLVSARRLGLDTTFSDVQATAILQSLTGITLADMLGAMDRRSSIHASNGSATDTGTPEEARNRQPVFHPPQSVNLDPWKPSFDCASNLHNQLLQDRDDHDDSCFKHSTWETVKGVIDNVAHGNLSAFAVAGRNALVKKLAQSAAIEGLQRLGNWVGGIVRTTKTLRLLRDSDGSDSARDYDRGASGSPAPTKNGLKRIYESMRDFASETTRAYPGLISRAERDYAGRHLNAGQRAAFADIVNESDRQRSDAETIVRLEDVHIGEADPLEALRDDSGGDREVGSRCEAGYQEFSIDDNTSTCVFASLVERNCYAGSRRVSTPDLGQSGANVCLYYSLDFFQANGTCRQNYAKVRFKGRETCRWAALGASKRAWYTLYKPPGDEPPDDEPPDDEPQRPGPDGGQSVGFGQTTVMVPEGQSATGYQITSMPEAPDVSRFREPPDVSAFPKPPDVSGLDGCRGNRDSQGNRHGRWVCAYSSGAIDFDTYSAGTLHGPSGGYDANGRPSETWGNYENGRKGGLWFFFYSSGSIDFDTYSAGTLHGPSGGWDANGRPSETWGNYENGRKGGLWFFFYSSGSIDFDTYSDDTLHGPSGGWDANGRPSETWGNYENGRKGGLWFFFYSSGSIDFDTYSDDTLHGPSGGWDANGRPSETWGSYEDGKKSGRWFFFYSSGSIDFDTYSAGTLHGPSGDYNADGERHGYFGSYTNGNRSGTWTWYQNGQRVSTTEY